MAAAFGWGLAAASSLILGGAIALRVRIGDFLLGLITAFGVGVLISAVSYDLVQEAFKTADGFLSVGLGFAAGAIVFFAGDYTLDRKGGESGLGVVLGTVLDGIPESMVIGLTLVGGGKIGVAVLAAVFLSNLPESLSASAGLKDGGWNAAKILGLWGAVAVVSALACLFGFSVFDTAANGTVAFVNAFAGGAILVMLSDTMMPDAFKKAKDWAGLATALGFALAFVLTTI
ncbi:MAG: zinc transporter, family [Solirubrobacteraceae bacterium]|jgi:ZIP family zinc transporter|nr:zinc transporter, family [Solirubrobacteraceae bacterium]